MKKTICMLLAAAGVMTMLSSCGRTKITDKDAETTEKEYVYIPIGPGDETSKDLFASESDPGAARDSADSEDPIDPDEYDVEEILSSVESPSSINASYIGAWVKAAKRNVAADEVQTIYWRIVKITSEHEGEVAAWNEAHPDEAIAELKNPALNRYAVVYQVYYPEDYTDSTGEFPRLVIKDMYGEDIEGIAGQIPFCLLDGDVDELHGTVVTVIAIYSMLETEPNFVFDYSYENGNGSIVHSYIRNR